MIINGRPRKMMNNHYIYYGQYTGISFISMLIRRFTWHKRSHSAAFFSPDEKGNFHKVIEAWHIGGVQERAWTEGHSPGTKIDVYRVPCESTQAVVFYLTLKKEIGKKYDWLGILGFLLRSNVQNKKRWFCSELVFYAAQRAGITLLTNVEPCQVYPGMLDEVPDKEFVTSLIIPKRS